MFSDALPHAQLFTMVIFRVGKDGAEGRAGGDVKYATSLLLLCLMAGSP